MGGYKKVAVKAYSLTMPVEELESFVKEALLKAGVREDAASQVAEALVQTSVRGVDSHGIRLLPLYIEGVEGGQINPRPDYKFKMTSASTGILDADHTFGHAAGIEAAKKAVELANEAGTGHVAVYNSNHFGAAAVYALEIAKHDMIGMSFTNADALVKSYGGRRAFLGNNPICFAAPCKGEEPFCLDMATGAVAFNKIRHLRETNMPAPAGIGADSEGNETTDPNKITMLLPIGGYKGYGLSMAVEILCSLLAGMPYGPHIPNMFDTPMSQHRYIAHFISAIRIDCFQDKDTFKKRLSEMINELRNEPAMNKEVPVQVAGDPEKNIAAKRKIEGVPLTQAEYEAFRKISEKYGIKFPY